MADLYGIVDASGTITKFYVSPDFGAAGSNQLLIQNVAKGKANEYPLRKTVNGADGYKYKWASPSIAAKTDTEIKDGLEWKKNKKDQLTGKAKKDITDLEEDEIHSLVGKELLERKNSGPSLTATEITKIQDFEDSRQSILDGVNTSAETDNFSKAKKNTIATNAPDIEVKKPGAFTVGDEITITDDKAPTKEETATIDTIVGDKLTFDTALTNTTKYKQNTTWVYKTG